MNIEKLKNISIIALCLSIASIVAIGGGFAVIMMITQGGRGID